MSVRDDIGRRGEIIFSARITNFCGRSIPYFRPYFLGEKAQAIDFLVELVNDEGPTRFFCPGCTRRSTASGQAET